MSIGEKIGIGCAVMGFIVLALLVCWFVMWLFGWWTLSIPTFVVAGYSLSTFIVSLENKSTFMAEIHKDIQKIKDTMP